MSLLLILTLFLHLNFVPLVDTILQQDSISNVEATYQFGKTVSITASLPQNSSIDQVMVTLQPENGGKAQTTASIAENGNLAAEFDLSGNPIRVFDRVYYWFDITYLDGTTVTTPSYWFDYLDDRYDWQKSDSKWFVIYTTPTSKLSTDQLQEIALAGLKNATAVIPISPSLPLTIYVYPDQASLTSALGISEQEWAAGQAKPELGVILVSESADINNQQELERQIPHEIAHLLEYAAAGSNYTYVPTWLLEGLATSAETYTSADNERLLESAHSSGNLISLDQLCTSFPPDPERSTLAYAESASFVTYLSKTYGNDKLLALLQTNGNGVSCVNLPVQLLGKDLTMLESDWLAATFAQNSKSSSWLEFWPVVLLIPILFVFLFLIRRHGKTKHLKDVNGK
jgi:hypothetical protein